MAESSSQNVDDQFFLKLVLFGDWSAGKTSFVMRFVRNQFDPHSKVIFGDENYYKNVIVDGESVFCTIWDLPGANIHRDDFSLLDHASDGGLAIFDLTHRKTFDGMNTMIEQYHQNTVLDQPTILIGNKSDLITNRQVTYEEDIDFAQQLNIPYIEASVLNGENVDEAFLILIRNILKKKK